MAGSGLDGASTVQMTLFSDLLTRRFVNRQDPRTSNPHDLPSILLEECNDASLYAGPASARPRGEWMRALELRVHSDGGGSFMDCREPR